MIELYNLERKPADEKLTQEEAILVWYFKHPGLELMKHEINREIVPWMLRGSVARALRNLVKWGWLEKVVTGRKTDFGKSGHAWRLPEKFKERLTN